MATPKPQIRSLFATPVCQHFLPIAAEANAELKPIILERSRADGSAIGKAWRSKPDFDSWGGVPGDTLFRVLRELADTLTATRAGGRVSLDWKISAQAAVRQQGESSETPKRSRTFWSGVYFVDDGYQNSEDEALGGECELADPRGSTPASVAPELAFRVPGGLTAGKSEAIRPKSGMIVMHPSWMARSERRFEGPVPRITIEFDLSVP